MRLVRRSIRPLVVVQCSTIFFRACVWRHSVDLNYSRLVGKGLSRVSCWRMARTSISGGRSRRGDELGQMGRTGKGSRQSRTAVGLVRIARIMIVVW